MGEYANDFNYCKTLGDEYMDKITIALFKQKGICLNAFSSKKYQLTIGESMSGIEVKHDSKYFMNNNFYFEVSAVNKTKTDYVDGGIMKNDNAWLYIIGTDYMAYAFSKNYLRKLYLVYKNMEREKREDFTRKTGIRLTSHSDNENNTTSYGLIIPLQYAIEHGWILFELDLTKE